MHVTEQEVSHLLKLDGKQPEEVACLDLLEVGLCVRSLNDLEALLYALPHALADVLKRAVRDNHRHALSELLIVTSRFLDTSSVEALTWKSWTNLGTM